MTIRSAFIAAAQEKTIDTQRSSLTIHVGKAGLFSAAAHEHWVTAPFAKGSLNDGDSTLAVRFEVEARTLAVKPEKGLSERDHAEVQSTLVKPAATKLVANDANYALAA